MEQLTHMVTFARVVQAGSFAGGAKRLSVTTSVASKHVAKLEHALGAKLLNRSTRTLSLTEAGTAYLEHCVRVADEFENAGRAVTRLQAQPAGLLRVSAPPAILTHHVAPHLAEFHESFPEVRIDFDASNRLVDLAEDGFDLALRIVREPSPVHTSQKLASLHTVLCAAPKYLQRRGEPRTIADIDVHDCLAATFSSTVPNWTFRKNGQETTVHIKGIFAANTVEPLRKLALAGLGLTPLPTFLIGEDLQQGRLVRLLPDYTLVSGVGLYAVHLAQPYVPPKLRCFIDFLADRYGPTPYWDRGVFDMPIE